MYLEKGIAPTHYFSLCTGVMLKNIQELEFALQYMSDEELKNHVNNKKNDFSAWIKDVFGEDALASELSKAMSRKDMQLVLLRHLAKKR